MPSHQTTGTYSGCPPPSVVSMDPCSPEGSSNHRSGRQRLRPWLEAQVNSGEHRGLEWLDAEKRIFRMTWKHGGRADWSEEDGSIFKAWAVHTGRFREGVDEPDWPTWKTRLRCAINKQKPDIQELKDLSCNEEPHPYRVFQFISRNESGSNSPPGGESPESVTEEVDGFTYPVQNRPSVIQANNGNIPNIISESLDSKPSLDKADDSVDAQVSSLGSDFQHVNIKDLVSQSVIPLNDISIDSNINSYNEAMDTDSLKGASGQQIKAEPPENQDLCYLRTTISDHEMLVTLRFREEIAQQMTVTNSHGCRVYYGDIPYTQVWNPDVFGSEQADQILVPYQPGCLRSHQQEEYTQKVLNGLELGISISVDKRNIYVERRCKTRIITAPANKGDNQTEKVERKQRLKVFDFQDFLRAFMRYQLGEGPRPSPQVIIAIGQDFHTNVNPYTHLFFSVTVCHAQASDLLSHYIATTTDPEISTSDNFDQHMTMLKKEKATIPMSTMNQVTTPEPAHQDTFIVM